MVGRFLRGKWSIWSDLIRSKSRPIYMGIILIFSAAGVTILFSAQDNNLQAVEMISRRDHEEIIRALDEQMTIIKWVGGAIVGALASAVALLYRSLEKSNNQTHKDLVEGIQRRENLIKIVVDSTAAMEQQGERVEHAVGELRKEVRELKEDK